MDQPYSAWADWLDKFYNASEGIQALWIVAVTVTVLGLTFIVMRGLVDMARVLRKSANGEWQMENLSPPVRPAIRIRHTAVKPGHDGYGGLPGQARP